MKFLHYLLPNVTPKGVALLGDLFIIRERILHTLMLFASGMALVGFAVILTLSFQREIIFKPYCHICGSRLLLFIDFRSQPSL